MFTTIIITIKERESDEVRKCHQEYQNSFFNFIKNNDELSNYYNDIDLYIDHEVSNGIFLILKVTEELYNNKRLLSLIDGEGHSAMSSYLDNYFSFCNDEGETLDIDEECEWRCDF